MSVTGAAAIAPSTPIRAPTQASTSSRVTSGRAASWTTAVRASGAAASALRTDGRARGAALDPAFAQPAGRGGHDHAVADGFEHLEAPLDQRTAGTNDERLGPVGSKAFAAAAGGNDPDERH